MTQAIPTQIDPGTAVTVRFSRSAVYEAVEVWGWDDEATSAALVAADEQMQGSKASNLTVPVTLSLAAVEDFLKHLAYTGWWTDADHNVRQNARRAWRSISDQLAVQTGKAYRP